MTTPRVARIVSGGQTGVDRAALDAALRLGIGYGGWCPRDGWAEDATDPPGILAVYPLLAPTGSADPAQRTRLNVRDSDATLVVVRRDLDSPGTALTLAAARALGRPTLVVTDGSPVEVTDWLRELGPQVTLNVAGPRESEWPGAYAATRTLLEQLWAAP